MFSNLKAKFSVCYKVLFHSGYMKSLMIGGVPGMFIVTKNSYKHQTSLELQYGCLGKAMSEAKRLNSEKEHVGDHCELRQTFMDLDLDHLVDGT